MIAARAKANFHADRVRQRARKGNIESLGHAAAATRLTIRRMIRRRKKPGPPGRPIGTPTGRAKGAIAYDVAQPDGPAVIGPMASRIGPSMSFHEKGGRRGNRYLPARPTVGPALAQIGPRLSKFWVGSIH
jgi:hypothetical protein